MEIRVLRYFLAIVQHGSISQAALALHLSQPALSLQIKNLEKQLGTTLFTRGPRTIQLTAKGHYLADRATEIVALVDKATENLQANDTVIGGNLDIGAGEAIGMHRLMTLLGHLQTDYPDVSLHLHSGDANDVLTQLRAGLLDFGVIMGTTSLDSDEYDSLLLPERDYWGVVMRKDALLAKQSSIQAEELIGYPLMVSEQGSHQLELPNWWRNVAPQLNFIGTFNLIFNTALLVKDGACLAITFENLVDTDDESPLTFRRLTPPVSEPTTLVWRRHHPQSAVAKLFLERLRANLQSEQA